ncbi:MAG: hypothetical protein B6D55_06130, partial [Candidatus Omnitrophica bacterium 4484_70.2]
EFGIEVGTLTSFYSRKNPELGNVKILEKKEKFENNNIYIQSKILIIGEKGDNAEVEIKDDIKFYDTTCMRKVIFKFCSDSTIRDVVSRYILNTKLIKRIKINNHWLTHKGKNKYYQFESEIANISLPTSCISFLSKKTIQPQNFEEKFKKTLYFRDETVDSSPVWIFHSRFLVKQPEIIIFKGCTKKYNKSFPLFLNTLLLKTKFYKICLDIREKYSQKIPFQANGGIKVEKETTFIIEDEWKII